MSFNRNWYGYSPATDKQIIGGSAPFVYNHSSHDNLTCAINKAAYNNAHSAMYSPDTIVRSHPAGSLMQSSTMNIHENAVRNTCHPSFKVDISTPADKYFKPWFT